MSDGSAERTPHRERLVKAAERVGPTVRKLALDGERQRTLPAETLEAFRREGLLGFKVPSCLGGSEADPLTQIEVLEEVSAHDGAAGWSLAIQGGISGVVTAFLSEDAIGRVLEDGIPRLAGALAVGGEALPDGDGYRVRGRWHFGSGIRHANWVMGSVAVPSAAPPHNVQIAVVPREQVEIDDNWHVAGLRGTGSCDFAMPDLHVPAAFMIPAVAVGEGAPARGGALYRMGFPGFVAMEHAAIALGIGRRTLEESTQRAQEKLRGGLVAGTQAASIGSRARYQGDLGRAEMKLRAARALAFDVTGEAWAVARSGEVPPPRLQAAMRAAAREATDVAIDVAAMAYRYAGGGGLFETDPIQRALRDVQAASQHFVVADSAFEALGQLRLGIEGAHPMQ